MTEVTDALLERVKKEAFHIVRKLPYNIDVDDLVQMGVIGLLNAQKDYRPQEGASFETYASHKIRGAIRDGLRKQDWMGRTDRAFKREEARKRARMEQAVGRQVTEPEIAAGMGMALQDYQRKIGEVCIELIPMFDSQDRPAEEREDQAPTMQWDLAAVTGDPEKDTIQRQWSDRLAEAIEKLPPRERLVLRLRYEKDLMLHEIGTFMSVTESRACQLHTKAISRLRKALKQE